MMTSGRQRAKGFPVLTNRVKRFMNSIVGGKYDILARIVRDFDRAHSCSDVVFLGDSTVLGVSNEDQDRRSTAEMLAADLSGKARVLELSHGAYHMAIYYHMVNTFRVTRQQPRLVIIPINMRSFSPQWYLRPAWEFMPEIRLLRRYYSGKGLRLRYRKAKVEEGYEKTCVQYPMTRLRTIGEFEELRLNHPDSSTQQERRRRELFIYFFLYPISESHPLLVKLREMVELAQMLRIRILFYVTPINMEAAIRSVGQEFERYFSMNAKVVMDTLTKEKCVFVKDTYREGNDLGDNWTACMDYSRALGSDCFFHSRSIDEHLNEKGRRCISKGIRTVALKLFESVGSAVEQG